MAKTASMPRKRPKLTLPLLLVLGAILIAAPSATAANGTVTVSAGTTSFTAAQTGTGHTWGHAGGAETWFCNSATFAGAVSNGAVEMSMTPAYEKCEYKVIFWPVTIETNGCIYRFVLTGTNEAGTEWNADMTLVCPEGPDVRVKTFMTEANQTEGVSWCEYTYAPQTLGAGVTVRNLAGGKLGVKFNKVLIFGTRTKGPIGFCGGATTSINGETEVLPSAGALEIH